MIARLASHKLLQPKVDRFRKEHDDWQSLAAFILSKNTGRRFKKKKATNAPKKVVARTGSATVDDKQSVSESSDVSETEETESMDCVDPEDSDSTDERSMSPEMQIAKTECDNREPSRSSDDECTDSDDSADEHVSVPCVTAKVLPAKPKFDKAMSKSLTALNKASKTESRDNVGPVRTLPQAVAVDAGLDLLEEKKSQVKSKLKIKTDTKMKVQEATVEKLKMKTKIPESTEMVVETLNLDEFHSEGDIVVKSGFRGEAAPGKDLSFLYTKGAESPEKAKKKQKDPFFMDESGSDEDDKSSDDGDSGSKETAGKTETQSLGRRMSKNAVQSSFIDTLSRPSSSRMPAKRER